MQSATLDTARRALQFISPADRDTWVRMGMALKDEFGDEAYDVWIDWSQGADSFDAKAAKSAWRSFKIAGKLGIGTLFAEAKAKGFEFDKAEAEPTPEQIAARLADKEARRLKQIAEEKRRVAAAQSAAKRAASQWRMAALVGESPYLSRKRVGAENCRFLADGAIIIPMIRYDKGDDAFVGKQQINADGSKKYSSGMDKQRAMCCLGSAPIDGTLIYVCEGYATGLSIREALFQKASVFVCFDTSNLLAGAKILRSMYAKSQIIFCADDDYLTGEAGRKKAEEAARVVGNARVFLPTFTTARRQSKDDLTLPMLTDCNDLHVSEGLDVLARSLDEFLMFEPAPSIADQSSESENGVMPPAFPADAEADSPPLRLVVSNPGATGVRLEKLLEHFALVYGKTDVWDSLNKQLLKKAAFIAFAGKDLEKQWLSHPDRKHIDPKDLPVLKGGRAIGSRNGEGGDPLKELIDRYVLLYGTETVWDREARKVVGLGPLRAAHPDLAGRWLEHPKRDMRDADLLVFDPSQRCDPETHINMFSGYPLTPKKNERLEKLVLQLVASLCSSERNAEEVLDWLIKWLAYPLQNPGAKMATAVLMFGEKQGTGKSLFFDGIMRPIYGEYGTTAGQHQLESNFTDWRSRKTFVLFEEVLGRAERHNYIGTIKHMITGKDMRINPKGLPERVEGNHLNSVFLSNERQPLPLDEEDRRFLVIEALAHQFPEFYAQFKQAIKDGACEAFYHYLLNIDLGDFNEHTKPVFTDSKRAVISFGLPSWEVFYQRWRDGEAEVPYCSCLSEELHQVFMRWCDRSYEKKLAMNKWSDLMEGRETRARKRVYPASELTKKMRTVFMIGDNADEKLDADIARFRASFNDKP